MKIINWIKSLWGGDRINNNKKDVISMDAYRLRTNDEINRYIANGQDDDPTTKSGIDKKDANNSVKQDENKALPANNVIADNPTVRFWAGFKEFANQELTNDPFEFGPTGAENSHKIKMPGFKPAHFTVRSDAVKYSRHFIKCKVRFYGHVEELANFEEFFHKEVRRNLPPNQINPTAEKGITVAKEIPDLYAESKWEEYYWWLLDTAKLYRDIYRVYYKK